MPIRTCRECGKRTTNLKYCSRDCYNNSQRKGKVVNCHGCQKEFYLKPHQLDNQYYYCSRTCKTENPPTSTRLICQNCKEYYYVLPSQAKGRKFCSKKCAGESFRKYKKSTCPVCGTEFEQPRGRPKKCCSPKCAGIAKRKMKECTVCGKEYWNKNSTSKYCSDKCKTKAIRASNKQCLWCGDKFHPKKPETKFCCITCSKMYNEYGDKDLRQMMEGRPIEAFYEGGEKSVWLPLSATEIEITLYLHYKGLRLSEIRRHIKRWRKARKEKEKAKDGVPDG